MISSVAKYSTNTFRFDKMLFYPFYSYLCTHYFPGNLLHDKAFQSIHHFILLSLSLDKKAPDCTNTKWYKSEDISHSICSICHRHLSRERDIIHSRVVRNPLGHFNNQINNKDTRSSFLSCCVTRTLQYSTGTSSTAVCW